MENQESLIQRFIRLYWQGMVIFFVPLIFLPIIIFYPEAKYRCLYVVIIMAFYWVFEVLPLGVTALIPIFLFPVLSIMDTQRTCMNYMKETVMMFLGSIVIASAIEYCGLHIRLALRVMLWVGCTHRRLHVAIMLMTMFVSMWITNTAAVAMVCPICTAIIEELEKQGFAKLYEDQAEDDDEPPKPTNLTLAYFLGAAYSASIGGVGTLVGTGTNLTLKGIFESMFTNGPGIDFPKFMIYNVPPMLINTIVTIVWLQFLYMGLFRPNSEDAKVTKLDKEAVELVTNLIRERYKQLGGITTHEILVGIVFLLAVFLWFFRAPGFITGWAEAISDIKIQDSTASIMVILLLFMLPVNLDFFKFCSCASRKDENGQIIDQLPKRNAPGLLTWKFLNEKMPWGLMFLLGGGFALADGGTVSGMSAMIGSALQGLAGLPPIIVLFLVLLCCEIITEFTSNVAIANIVLPVVGEMAKVINMSPMYLMIPAGIACSYAFHMPVGTPPNAIVSGLVNIPTNKMIVAGVGPSVITLITLWIFFPTYGALIYPNLLEYPSWADDV